MTARPWKIVAAVFAVLAAALLILAHFGLLQSFYQWSYLHTTGRPWTYIMRDHPWYLIVPALIVVTNLAAFLPERKWSRIFIVNVVLFLGFLGGHVFWSG